MFASIKQYIIEFKKISHKLGEGLHKTNEESLVTFTKLQEKELTRKMGIRHKQEFHRRKMVHKHMKISAISSLIKVMLNKTTGK